MGFTNPGWHLLSTTTQQTWSQATNAWGISSSTVYKYIYELKNAPIQTGLTLTKDNWTQIDITTNPTLMPMTAYWVNIQALILNPDKIFNGSGELTNATSQLNGAKTVTIQGYTSIGNQAFYYALSLQSITIPASVTRIGYNAFAGATALTTVTFVQGSQLTSIGVQAFNGARSLQSITIPDTVTSIGNSAFQDASSLQSINIPALVTSIGNLAFYRADKLLSIIVNPNNNYYSSDAVGVLFDKNKNKLIQYPTGNSLTSYIIPNTVTTVEAHAAIGATSLQSITIPASVTSIGDLAFEQVLTLNSVIIAANSQLTSIGSQAFLNTRLTSITIPASVTSIGSNAFYNSGLKTVIFESITNLESLGLIIQDTSQNFFGATGVQVLPKKAAVQTALSAAVEQVGIKQTLVSTAELEVYQAQTNLSNQNPNDSWAVSQANDQLTNAQNQLTIAQTQLTAAEARVEKLTNALSWAV
jgi:hypothetical protein